MDCFEGSGIYSTALKICCLLAESGMSLEDETSTLELVEKIRLLRPAMTETGSFPS